VTQRSLRLCEASLWDCGSIFPVLLLGAWLRFHALAQAARFHPDEALFATFARNAAVQGDWLLHGPLDKPPLTIYANALAMTFFGVTTLPDGVLTLDVQRGEFAARVPGVFASILLMAVMYALAKTLYAGKRTRYIVSLPAPLIALLFLALSPFALAFSATAFTDGLMLLCVTLALWMGSRGRWLWAGLWLAIGFGCKQQALFYVPLVLGMGWAMKPHSKPEAELLRSHSQKFEPICKRLVLAFTPPLCTRRGGWGGRFEFTHILFQLFVPIVLGIILLVAWDAARGQETSLWALAIANNEPGRLELAADLLPRLSEWLGYAQYFVGYGWLTGILMMLGLGAVVLRFIGERQLAATRADGVMTLYVVAYLLLHALAFNLYDRYLLFALPPVVLLLARGVDYLTQRCKGAKAQGILILSVFVVLSLPAALAATAGQIPVGSDQGKHAGIDELGDYLNRKPLGTIIYDHWLGWELGYYIGAWSDKRRVYYPSPQVLVADALLQPDPAPRYLVIPDWVDGALWLTNLESAGFGVSIDYQQSQFSVYQLLPPPR
jgi:hypothetical protein